MTETLLKHFPKAIEGHKLTIEVVDTLMKTHQFTPKNTLFGFSTCPDELNRDVTSFKSYYGEHQFPLGGLTGYPFRGKTGFAAFSHHAPNNQSEVNFVILYGPHVGISPKGELGKVLRENQFHESTACGAAISFLNKYKESMKNGKKYEPVEDALDMEQYSVEKMMLSHAYRIISSQNHIKELVEVNYMLVDEAMMKIIESLKHHFNGKIALVGGIMINTPHHNGYFDLRRFEVHNTHNEIDLLKKFL